MVNSKTGFSSVKDEKHFPYMKLINGLSNTLNFWDASGIGHLLFNKPPLVCKYFSCYFKFFLLPPFYQSLQIFIHKIECIYKPSTSTGH